MYALINCKIYAQDILTEHALLIQGNRILDTLPQSRLAASQQTIDLAGANLAPGFIDLQLNGCGGVMFNDAIAAATLETMHQTNLKSGTTSYLPTLITTSDADMLNAMDTVLEYRQHRPYNVLGLHLEGPYLNPQRKGIHNSDYIRPPDSAMLEKIAAAGSAVTKIITVAVEEIAPEQIRQLVESGIVVSAGHTAATFEQANLGFDAGVSMVTHLFNAMTPWLGRSPGVVGATLSRPEIYAGIIADGHHLHFGSVGLAQKIKQDRLLLVTDATPPAGTQMQSFQIGGQEVFYRDGKCVSADGTLGGSALTMIEAVANCVQQLHLPLAEVLPMATLYPARAIRVDHELGKIAPGYIANLAVFDAQFRMQAVVDCGQYLAL
ncbi:MAG: N-acetylglucosamine-6-phosphate deacetylase [Pegethrix bostrychoides GSE-TBD4-15B]|jgi:N-acetylglucosamine-6-phosphate deacetylase|uniref:N-acetylglucosamine-6-phosphate deacetylase n=1 Tax=Pegethrix bostrychoides GSE-TBD4-15B TaxID=2839662 RepID=A0A951P8P0_9CYAN|nr:N-acetylglucosamine-6-phosphate deacetylase [Pegethrix bostrychoides GSE-TBD4-15B]